MGTCKNEEAEPEKEREKRSGVWRGEERRGRADREFDDGAGRERRAGVGGEEHRVELVLVLHAELDVERAARRARERLVRARVQSHATPARNT